MVATTSRNGLAAAYADIFFTISSSVVLGNSSLRMARDARHLSNPSYPKANNPIDPSFVIDAYNSALDEK